METPHQRAKRPVSLMAGGYGHPLHPALATVPIGAWFASLVFDLASRHARAPGFLAQGSLWLITIGVIGAFAAASLGFLDLSVIQQGGRARRIALVHMSVNVAVITAYLVNGIWRLASYRDPGPVNMAVIALSAVSFAALAVSGYLGGTLAYRYGVRVADEYTQAEGYPQS